MAEWEPCVPNINNRLTEEGWLRQAVCVCACVCECVCFPLPLVVCFKPCLIFCLFSFWLRLSLSSPFHTFLPPLWRTYAHNLKFSWHSLNCDFFFCPNYSHFFLNLKWFDAIEKKWRTYFRHKLGRTISWHMLDGFLCLWHTKSTVPEKCMNDCD